MDVAAYLETCVRESDFVLLVCTPTFCRKADAGKGGVGYEKTIITGEIYQGIGLPKKFVPLLREASPIESLPSYLKTKMYVDFLDDKLFAQSFEELLRHIYESPRFARPPLGQKPSFISARVSHSRKAEIRPKGFDLSGFKKAYNKAYNFAYSLNGMNMTDEDAQEWAEWWMTHCADKDLAIFKRVYKFAYGSLSGMDMSSEDAQEWAEWWMTHCADKNLSAFKVAYNYARSFNGMNMADEDAQEWAEWWMQNHADDDLKGFKRLYKYACSFSGLNKDDQDAAAWARKKFGKA